MKLDVELRDIDRGQNIWFCHEIFSEEMMLRSGCGKGVTHMTEISLVSYER